MHTEVQPPLLMDGYKIDHRRQFIEYTREVHANMTPRKSRIPEIQKVVSVGVQFYKLSTLIELWNKEFFRKDIDDISADFLEEMEEYLLSKDAANAVGTDHWRALHKLGYLPIELKTLDEGTLCPIGVPCYTIKNTHHDFYWITNAIETDMSAEMWGVITSATLAFEYKKIFTYWAKRTGGDLNFIRFQGHNFSYRGLLGRHAAALVDMGHMFSFVGSDTIPGRKYMKKFYKAKQTGFNDIISCSVAATEHAVMCVSTGFYIKKNNLSWERYGEAEFAVFKRLILEVYPTGIISIVSDTWNLWKVLTEYLPLLRDEILARDGKLVIRPDSGDPVDILCGTKTDFTNTWKNFQDYKDIADSTLLNICKAKGVIELLHDVFGGTTNELGYRTLNPKIGVIYGDAITIQRAWNICSRLADKKFVSTSWVAGIGSYTYQYVTRDTFGFAQKATYAVVEIDSELVGIDVFKDPITDDGTKRSAKGAQAVFPTADGKSIYMKDQCTPEEEQTGLLKVVLRNGVSYREQDLEGIRAKLEAQIEQEISHWIAADAK